MSSVKAKRQWYLTRLPTEVRPLVMEAIEASYLGQGLNNPY